MPQAVHHLHRGHDPAVAAGPLRQGARCAHRRDTNPSSREPLAPHQVAQLPVAHSRQGRRHRGNVDEVIMLDAQGYVAEASGMNLFAVTNSTLKTPPAYAGILRGVTRDAVIELA